MKKVYLLIVLLIISYVLAGCKSVVRFSSADNKIEPQPKKLVITDDNKKIKTKSNKNIKPIYEKSKHSDKIIYEAKQWLGTPYLYGGTTKKGVDCSGFVKNVYANIGVKLPRTSGEQYVFATAVKIPNIGDLVFFKKNKKINHVGIYIGDNTIIHSSTSKGVITQKLAGTILEKRLAGYGKVI